MLVHFILFLHVNFLFILVVELVFEEGELLVGNEVHSETVFQLPKQFTRKESFVDVCFYKWMNVEVELLYF